jgi:hypothetical protein
MISKSDGITDRRIDFRNLWPELTLAIEIYLNDNCLNDIIFKFIQVKGYIIRAVIYKNHEIRNLDFKNPVFAL